MTILDIGSADYSFRYRLQPIILIIGQITCIAIIIGTALVHCSIFSFYLVMWVTVVGVNQRNVYIYRSYQNPAIPLGLYLTLLLVLLPNFLATPMSPLIIKKHVCWLLISTCVEYKILLSILNSQLGVVSKYLCDFIRAPLSATFSRPLCSSDRLCPRVNYGSVWIFCCHQSLFVESSSPDLSCYFPFL